VSKLKARATQALGWGTPRMVAAIAVILAALGVLAFIVGGILSDVAPSSTLGIVLGIGALLSLVGVMAYSARRSVPARRTLGPSRTYLQVHLWGGGLFLVLFLVHTAFRLPGGLLYFCLWSLSLWVVLTGVVGVVLQKSLPRILEPSSSFEVNLQRIPELVDELRLRAEAAAAGAEPRVKTYYDQHMAPDMASPRMITAVLFRNARVARRGTGEVDILRRTLPPEGIAALEALREIHNTKHEMDVHYTLQRILRGWLYLHLPAAVVLLGVVLLHVFFVFYF
jgi:hypothetical protein